MRDGGMPLRSAYASANPAGSDFANDCENWAGPACANACLIQDLSGRENTLANRRPCRVPSSTSPRSWWNLNVFLRRAGPKYSLSSFLLTVTVGIWLGTV